MGARKLKNHQERESIGNEIINSIFLEHKKKAIDLVIIADDFAFFYIGSKLLNHFKIVFVGISGSLENYNSTFPFYHSIDHPGGNVTGVFQYLPICESILALNHLGKFAGKKIMIIYDNGVGKTYKDQFTLDYSIFGKQLEVQNIGIDERIISTDKEFRELINLVNKNSTYAGLYPLVIELLDDQGKKKFDFELKDYYTKKPSFGATPNTAHIGLTWGISYDASDANIKAGEIASRILNGENISEIPITLRTRKSLFFNLDETDRLGITIPQEWKDRASLLYRYPRYSSLIFSIVVPVLITILISIVILILVIGFFSVSFVKHKKKLHWISNVTDSLVRFNFQNEYIKDLENNYKKNGRIGKILNKFNSNLKIYKPYLPTSLFSFSERTIDSFTDEEEDNSSSEKDNNGNHDNSNSSSSRDTSIEEFHSKFELHLDKKDLTFMICKLKNLKTKNISSNNSYSILKIVNAFLEIVRDECVNTNGNILFVNGTTLTVCWNATKQIQSNHAQKAANTALKICKHFHAKIKRRVSKFEKSLKMELNDLKVNISLFSSSLFCGNVGVKNCKWFTMLGNEEFEFADKICELNNQFKTSILVDQKCSKLLKYSHVMKGIFHSEICIFELICKKDMENNVEWIYAFAKQESILNDRGINFDSLNNALENYHCQKDFKKAEEEIDNYLTLFPNDNSAKELKMQLTKKPSY